MNRLPAWAPSAAIDDGNDFDGAATLAGERMPTICRLFTPLHYEPGYSYPLLVWLHGPGDNERQVASIMRHLSLRNYVAVGVQGTHCDSAAGAYCWRQTAPEIESAEERVLRAVERTLAMRKIARDRVYIAGLQCGGTMALRLALRNPGLFSAAASIFSPFPRGYAPLRMLADARKFPLWMGHARDSLVYGAAHVCRDLRLFHAANLRVDVRQYVCGDILTTCMLADMNDWLMERVNHADRA